MEKIAAFIFSQLHVLQLVKNFYLDDRSSILNRNIFQKAVNVIFAETIPCHETLIIQSGVRRIIYTSL